MAVHLQSAEISKDFVEFNNIQDAENILCSSDVNTLCSVTSKAGKDKIEEKSGLGPLVEDAQYSKTLNVREVHETSPFKQAVKGFVLNKLSKKVGSSHILSGLTEKIVKKLEDKDNVQPGLVPSSESDLNLSSLRAKEPSVEVISNSLSCELKSVVANDLGLSEVLNVEDAIDCLEEIKSTVEDNGLNIPYRPELRSFSISLPSSPAHRFDKRSSSVSGSLENVESTSKKIKPLDLSFLAGEKKLNEDCETELIKSSQQDETKLKEINKEESGSEKCANSEVAYLCNVYSSKKDEKPNLKNIMLRRFLTFFSFVKNVFTSLSLSHIFLLASVIIHNIDIISSYLAFIFDGLVIAYICYSYICILAKKPIPNPSHSLPFLDLHLENASIHIQKTNKIVKGSVKVLKGEYDPEMVKNHPTDLIDINIENCCLKIFVPKKKTNKDSSPKSESFASYNLLGATISLVPKDLPKKRVWNKKYPICIALPLSKMPSCADSCNDADTSSTDYLSAVYCENDRFEISNQKALYFFALTDREKETLFWVLQKNIEDTVDGVKSAKQPYGTSSKIDICCMTYTSLLELNSDDSLSFNKDIPEDDSLNAVDKATTDLEFDIYMKNLFENFERMNKFSSRSRSFEDLKNLKEREDLPRTSESVMSKDDTFLSSNTGDFSVDWLNVVLGRMFYDFLTQKSWSDHVKDRIQRKLDKIEMPTFIESLEVSDVFLGTSLPQIHTVSNPVADVNGVWLNFDFNYCGSFQMTLKTKLKMAKAKQLQGSDTLDVADSKNVAIPSSESDEEENIDSKNKSVKKKKLINRIEKWITHKHFQTVAQSRFVKKYVGDISNMPLMLTVELNTLHGTLTVNIPPAPTDRIWYGFRKDPVLSLNAYPKVGTHEINLSAVVQMIEKKLIQEFKKALVMPNMDDFLIPVMYTPIYDI